MFALREINQMEREMCSYLEWQLNVDPTELREFEHKVRRDFKGQGPYPTYNLPSPAPSPMPSTTPYTSTGTTRAPSFVTGQIAAGAGASAAPVAAPVAKPAPPRSGSQPIPIPERAYPSPPHSPDTPETPEASRSLSTSPASSASPPTPPGEVDLTVKIATPGGSVPMSVDPARMHTKHASSANIASSSSGRTPAHGHLSRVASAARSSSRSRSPSRGRCAGEALHRLGFTVTVGPPSLHHGAY